ncbi:hypothetical protein NEOC84_001715|nr:hypothetical protein [Neochlamydia sp. AcF84]
MSVDFDRSPASHFLAETKPKDWQSLSAGKGAKGERYYHWYRLEVNSDSPEGWTRWLLLRRNMKDPRDVAYYIACCPNNVTLHDMVKAAGNGRRSFNSIMFLHLFSYFSKSNICSKVGYCSL